MKHLSHDRLPGRMSARHWLRRWPLAGLCVLALAGCGELPAQGKAAAQPEAVAAADCEALAGRHFADGVAQVESAVRARAGVREPAACVVTLAFEGSALRAEARLPLHGWNGRMVMLGGGGFDGIFNQATEPYFSRSILDGRYATFTTNGGHDYPKRDLGYFQAMFAMDPDEREDFTHASEHRALPAGRAVVEAFYGRAPERSYYEGCSMGGHDALVLAQRHPGDFDGIIARAPAGNVMGLMLQFNRIARAARAPGLEFGSDQVRLLADAVRASCDAVDGRSDGVVADPTRCDFDPESLRCPAGEATGCLDEAQMALVQAATTPMQWAGGAWSHPGFPFSGGEDSPKGWGEYVLPNPALGGQSLQGLFSDGFLRSFIAGNPEFDTSSFDADAHAARLAAIGAGFNATDPDLSALHARGGKLILSSGTLDTSVSLRDTVDYYRQVVATLGAERAADTVELFLQPGVGHCFGGGAPDQIDLLAAMAAWVEQGRRPSEQGLRMELLDAAGQVTAVAPACAWPAVAVGEACLAPER